jgi:alanine racemase
VTDVAVAVIRSAAIRHNLKRLRSAAPGCRFMAVVKANAYGHGVEAIAELLDDVDALGVARVAEGVRLRNAGNKQRIVVLEGCGTNEELEVAIAHQLDIVVHDPVHFELLARVKSSELIKVWLKLDTGMGRLGFCADQFATCMNFLNSNDAIKKPIQVMTHLACADDVDNPMTAEQVRSFGAALNDGNGIFDGDISIANSAALLSWPQSLEPSVELNYLGDNWVRLGAAIFGVSPLLGKSSRDLNLRPAMQFESQLIAVKTIAKGDSVGYGSVWRAPRDTAVGVVAVGYGDGYPRQLPEGTPVLINDRRAALIGRVSMDMISVDLTDIPVAGVGDRAILWGDQLPIEEIASRAGTISYELMCGITDRVVKRYVE